MKQKTSKKFLAIAAGTGLVIGTVMGALAFPVENQVFIPSEPIVKKEVVTEYVNVTVPVEVEVVKEVTVEKIVEVDNGNLALVLDTIYDNDGDVEYLLDGLFDDELDQVVDRIALTNDMKAEAENVIKQTFARELDKQHGYDRRDVSKIKFDSEDTVISNIDFDDKESLVTVEVEFRYDGEEYTADVEVEFYDGNVQPIDISNVVLK